MNATCFNAAPLREIMGFLKFVGTQTNGMTWLNGMLLRVFHEQAYDADRNPVFDDKGNEVFEAHVKLLAHVPDHRATVIPLRTSVKYADLHTLRRNDKWGVRSLKRDLLVALHGEAWHVHATIENTDGTSDVGDEMPVVEKVGAADTDGSVRKRRRGRQHEARRAARDEETAVAA